MDFYIGLEPSTSGILYISPSFWLGGAYIVNVPMNKSQYLHNAICNNALYFSSTFSKCGIVPYSKFLLLYSISYKNNTGLSGVFKYLSFVTWELLMVPSRNS